MMYERDDSEQECMDSRSSEKGKLDNSPAISQEVIVSILACAQPKST